MAHITVIIDRKQSRLDRRVALGGLTFYLSILTLSHQPSG